MLGEYRYLSDWAVLTVFPIETVDIFPIYCNLSLSRWKPFTLRLGTKLVKETWWWRLSITLINKTALLMSPAGENACANGLFACKKCCFACKYLVCKGSLHDLFSLSFILLSCATAGKWFANAGCTFGMHDLCRHVHASLFSRANACFARPACMTYFHFHVPCYHVQTSRLHMQRARLVLTCSTDYLIFT